MELYKEDLDWCVKRLPNVVKAMMQKYTTKLSVGGGYIRSCITGDEIKDIDMFVNSEEVAETIAKFICEDGPKYMKTQNAYTIFRKGSTNIQLIYRWTYEKPSRVIDDLDFTVCCAVFWYEDGKYQGKCHSNYYQDLAARRLRYTQPSRNEDVGGSALRILKYYNKGYKITLDSYGKIIARLVMGLEGLRFDSWDDTAEHTNPNWTKEDQLAKVLIGLLVEVDPNTVREPQAVLNAPVLEDEEK